MTVDATARADERLERLEEAKARLEARGLLRTATAPTSVREPSSATIVLSDAGNGTVGTASAVVVAGSPCVDIPCPACAATRSVPVNRTNFDCLRCAEQWRWAICGACDRLALTAERLDAWACRGCGHVSRPWWRSSMPTTEPARIIHRRSNHVAALIGTSEVTAAGRSRAKTFAAAAGAAFVVVAAVLSFALVRASGEVGARGALCGRFERFASALDTGRLDSAGARAEVQAIAAAARKHPAFAALAEPLAEAPSFASTEFDATRTAFTATCAGG